MAATAPTEVFRPAGNTCCSDQPPASNDVESCSAPLRGLAIRCQKRAVLFPRRHGLPPHENCAFGAVGGRQQRARFAHLGLRTASRLFCPLLIVQGYPRGPAQSIDERGCSRPRSALRIQTPPLQRRTHRTPGCAPLKRRRHSPARSTCADVLGVRSSPLGADMVGKSRNMSADMLIMPGLLALMPPTICCVRSQSVRDLVTEISGGATPAPVRCGSEL